MAPSGSPGAVLTPERRWLATPWPWLAGAIAFALFAPHLLWQIQHDWPTAEFMQNATTRKMVEKSPLEFAASQLLALHPVLAPLWIAGLVHLLLAPGGGRHRILAWIWLTVFGLLAASGTARTNYLAPAYPPLLAAGAVACERLSRAPRWRWLPPAAAAVFALAGAASAPLAIPLLPPARFVAYQEALGVSAPREQVDELGDLPLHFALRFGWPELLGALAEAHAGLSPAEREQAVVLGSWFGDTGAVNRLGAEAGLPPAISGLNNYWLWGPGAASGEVLLALSPGDEQLRGWYEEVERVAEVDCVWCMPDVARLAVYVCRRPRRPLAEWWPELKRFE